MSKTHQFLFTCTVQKGAGVSFVGRRRQHMHNLTQLVWQELEMQARTQGRLELPDSFDRSSNIGVVQVLQ
jgi:hypothetical protein